MKKAFQLAVLALGLAAHAAAQDSLCAVVKLEISQEATLEREAFDARLVVSNNVADHPLTNLKVQIFFKDEEGQNAGQLFFVKVTTLTGTSAVDGTGVVQSSSTAEIHWLIIPSSGTGGQFPAGRRYGVSALITGMSNTQPQNVQTFDAFISVHPQPVLKLEYVLPYEVFGDEPLTHAIEPIEPFPLGVRVTNVGHGAAKNFQIDSAQPRIVENKQGLLIDFKLLGTVVSGQMVPNTLLIPFGDVASGGVKQASWIMSTTLSGRFIEFTSTFTHAAELGGELTSLLQSVTTYTLIKDVLVDLPGRDAVPDFLVNRTMDREDMQNVLNAGGTPAAETILESDQPNALPVVDVAGNLAGTLSGTNAELTFTLGAAVSANVWIRASVPFPHTSGLRMTSVRRSDGKALPLSNVWISKHFRKSDTSVSYRLNVFDLTSEAQSYTLQFDPASLEVAPGAVTNLGASTSDDGGKLNLSWTAPGEDGYSGGILGGRYLIQASENPEEPFNPNSSQVNIATSTFPGNPERLAADGLIGNTTYYLRLWTQDTGGGMSALSNAATAYVRPNPPRDGAFDVVGSSFVRASWQAGNNRLPVEYTVSLSSGGPVQSSPWQDSFDRTYVFNGLKPNTTYFLTGTSRNPATDVRSQQAAIGVVLTQAAPPSTATLTSQGTSSLVLSWDGEAFEFWAELSTSPAGSPVFAQTGWSPSSSYAFGGLEAGIVYYARVKARNAAYVETAYADLGSARTNTGDVLAPRTFLSISSPVYQGEGLFLSGLSELSLSAVDDFAVVGDSAGAAGVQSFVSVDGSTYTVAAGTFSLTGGTHTVSYFSTDASGNSEAPRSETLTVDVLAPLSALVPPATAYVDAASTRTYYSAGEPFGLSAADEQGGSGLGGIEYGVDRGTQPFIVYVGTFSVPQGARLLEYRARDNVENTENVNSVTLYVDGSAPITELSVIGYSTRSAEGALTVSTSSLISLAAADFPMDAASGVAEIRYGVDGATFPYTAPFGLAVGPHTVTFSALDRVGNRETEQTATVIVAEPPVACGSVIASPRTLEADLACPGSGVAIAAGGSLDCAGRELRFGQSGAGVGVTVSSAAGAALTACRVVGLNSAVNLTGVHVSGSDGFSMSGGTISINGATSATYGLRVVDSASATVSGAYFDFNGRYAVLAERAPWLRVQLSTVTAGALAGGAAVRVESSSWAAVSDSVIRPTQAGGGVLALLSVGFKLERSFVDLTATTGGGAVSLIQSDGARVSSSTIRNLGTSAGATGVSLSGGSAVSVSSNVIDVQGAAVTLGPGGGSGPPDSVVAWNTIASRGPSGGGVLVNTFPAGALRARVEGNVIEVLGTNSQGVAIGSSQNVLTGNRVTTRGFNGVAFSNPTGTDNVFTGNVVVTHGQGANGVVVNALRATITGNTVTVYGPDVQGVRVEGGANLTVVSSNVVTAAGAGGTALYIGANANQARWNVLSSSAVYIQGAQTVQNTTWEGQTLVSSGAAVRFSGVMAAPAAFSISTGTVALSFNRAAVNTAGAAYLNIPARLTLFGISFSTPVPLYDAEADGTYVDCPANRCSGLAYSGGAFGYDVTGFSAYSSRETPPTLVSLSVWAPAAALQPGDTVQLTATGAFSDASTRDMTQEVSWTVDASSVATVDALGAATAHAEGRATVTASSGTISAAALLLVEPDVSLSPSTGPIGVPFTIAGAGFGAYNGTNTRVRFGEGGPTAPISIWNDAAIAGTVPSLSTGTYAVLIERTWASSTTARSAGAFQVLLPVVSTMSPASGPIGTTFTMSGGHFGPYAGMLTQVLIDGATAPVSVWNDATIVATVPGGVQAGSRPVVVRRNASGGGVMDSEPVFFTVVAPEGAISPSTGPIGIPFTIAGSGFGAFNGTNTRVRFGEGGPTAPISVWNDATISGTIPTLSTGSYAVLVERQQGSAVEVSQTGIFEALLPAPVSVSPSSGPIGTTFTLSGAHFGPYAGVLTRVLVAGATCAVSVWNDSTIVATVPGAAPGGPQELVVERANSSGGLMRSESLTFTVVAPLGAINPSTGPVGIPFTVSGSGFGAYNGTNTRLRFGEGGPTAPISVWNDATISGTIPFYSTGSYTVIVERQQGSVTQATAISSFTLLSPAAASMTPAAGPIGAAFTISGAHFGPYNGTNTRVRFGAGGPTAPISVWNDATISGTVPSLAAGTYDVLIERQQASNTQAVVAASYTVTVPFIAEISPSSAPIGAPFTITGASFGAYGGTYTRVKFGGVSAPISVWNDTTITGTVPGAVASGTTTVVVESVVSGGGSSASAPVDFEVLTPRVDTMTPTGGDPGIAFQLDGAGFGPYAGTQTRVFFDAIAASISVWNDRMIRGVVPASLSVGTHTVVVRRSPSGGTVESAPQTFSVGGAGLLSLDGPSIAAARPDWHYEAALILPAEEGGTVSAPAGAGVVIPPLALENDVQVTVDRPASSGSDAQRRKSVAADSALAGAGEAVEYGPEGTRFSAPVVLELPYDPSAVPLGKVGELAVHYWDPSSRTWTRLETEVDQVRRVVRARTDHFSLYQPMLPAAALAAASADFGIRDVYAFPNPARRGAAATIRVQPGAADWVEIKVFDVAGEPVASGRVTSWQIIDDGNGKGPQRTYDWTLDVAPLGSGVYVYVVKAHKDGSSDERRTGRLAVIK